MTGAVLADLIARTDEGPFILVGHSLGARVMVTAAQALGTRPGLFQDRVDAPARGRGGQVRRLEDPQRSRQRHDLELLLDARHRLEAALRGGGTRKRAVGHSGFGSKFPRIKDRDVSRRVAGHSEYFTRVNLV